MTSFSNQKWNRLAESHASDIIVTWPDVHETNGITRHIEDLKAIFVYAPDTKIKEHPIRICSGEYTAVMAVMTGTFTNPMPTADGKSIAPTGKAFRLSMATIGQLEGEYDGPRMAVLEQPGVHAADRAGSVMTTSDRRIAKCETWSLCEDQAA